ncbi:MAG: hypothetical protein JXJ20_14175 [Anaerolineae bacterium]|nr:hypothetical protein [Anaerolineae bacterium]
MEHILHIRRRLFGLLPEWARPDHPVLHYMLTYMQRHWSGLVCCFSRSMDGLSVIVVLWFGQWLYRTGDLGVLFGQGETPLYMALYIPLVLLQLVAVISVMNTVMLINLAHPSTPRAEQQQSWEMIKLTSHGPGLVVRARWAAALYKIGWMLVLFVLARLVFVGQMAVDLIGYADGRLFVDANLDGMVPGIPPGAALLLVGLFMVAAVIQPLAAVGLYAAFGLLLSTILRRRSLASIIQMFVLLAAAVAFCVVMVLGWTALESSPHATLYSPFSPETRWWFVLFMAVGGDLSLRLLNLETASQMWVDVDYGIVLGPVILGVVLIEVLITMGMLRWVVWQMLRPARR